MEQQKNNELEDGMLGFLNILYVLWKSKFIIIGVTFLCGIGSIFTVLQMEKVYRVQALLKPVVADNGENDPYSFLSKVGGKGVGGLLGSSSPAQDTLAIIRTYKFLTPIIKDIITLPTLYPDVWVEGLDLKSGIDGVPTVRQGVNKFINEILFIEQDIDTGLVTLSVEWSNRKEAIVWVNSIVDLINKAQQEKAINDARRQKDFLLKEIGDAQEIGLKSVLLELLGDQIQIISIASTRKDYAFETVDPASSPDTMEAVRPKRALIVVFVTFLGGFLSLVSILLYDRFRLARNSFIKKLKE